MLFCDKVDGLGRELKKMQESRGKNQDKYYTFSDIEYITMPSNIVDVAPLLATHFIDVDSDLKLIKANAQLLINNRERIGKYYDYQNRLHDSWIINTTITESKFTFVLNDFVTHVFADAIIEKKQLVIEHDKLVFPVIIEFDVNNISFNTVEEDGELIIIEPTFIDEYLDEQIIKVNQDKVDVGLVVWKKNDGKPGKRILVLIDATNICLTEQQDQAWHNIFGNKYNKHYQYFKEQLKTGRFLADMNECLKLIGEVK